MGNTYSDIVKKIDAHLQKSGGGQYSDFYVGVAKNASERLFNEHLVQEKGQWWIYVTASSPEVAHKVEQHYLDLGMRGGNNESEPDAYKVYCYAVTPLTCEILSNYEPQYSE